MIEVEKLGKSYGNFPAVIDADFAVRPGEIVGLLGPNGAGKTSIMKVLTGYHFPTSGTAKVKGFDVSEHPLEVKAATGYLPESAPFYGEFTVEEYLCFVAEARKIGVKERTRALSRVVEECGLEKVFYRGIDRLSKGYRQRTCLAQALLHDPPVLILDEPTSGLDPNQIIEIRGLIKRLGSQKTVILSTHILQEVEALCDRVLIMNEGRIVAEGTREEIAARLKGDDRYRIEIKSGKKLTEKDLTAIPGFKTLASLSDDGAGTCEAVLSLNSENGGGEVLFDWAVESGYKLTALVRERYSLEDIFTKLTREAADV
jgi:ABC-2 type transport system ATP-binding protein